MSWWQRFLLIVLSGLYLFLYEPAAESATPALAPTGRLRQLGRWLMLLIPIIAAPMLSPNAFSASTTDKREMLGPTSAMAMPSSTGDANAKAVIATDPNMAVPAEVTDLITISQHPDQIKAFDGRKVRVVGLFENQDGNLKLVRWIMWCCAADAQPWSVSLGGNTAGDWKNEQWLEVIGTAQFPSTLGHVVPHIDVDSIKPVMEPDEPFLSP